MSALLSSCEFLNMFCAGSYCYTENYQFHRDDLPIVVKHIKKKYKQYDVLIKDSTGTYISKDKFEIQRQTLGVFYIYDYNHKCVVGCEIHNENMISIRSYIYPKCIKNEEDDEESCDGLKRDFFTLVVYSHYDKYNMTEEQEMARKCAEEFFELIGTYERLW